MATYRVDKGTFTEPHELRPRGRVVQHLHHLFVITDNVPASRNGAGAKLPGGLPPKTRDSNKGFNDYGPVWGVQQNPKKIGATGGERKVLARTNTSVFGTK